MHSFIKAIKVLEWLKKKSNSVCITTSFQKNGIVLLDLIYNLFGEVPWVVYSINTGFLFGETFDFSKEIIRKYNINFEWINPTSCPGLNDQDLCCQERKVNPLFKKVKGKKYWVNAIRSSQTDNRKSFNSEKYFDSDKEITRIMPLLQCDSKDIENYIVENNLPMHPLYEKGYSSIGCYPCTSPTFGNLDDRSGRWADSNKIECGLHVAKGKE